jgi:hypothetical protein
MSTMAMGALASARGGELLIAVEGEIAQAIEQRLVPGREEDDDEDGEGAGRKDDQAAGPAGITRAPDPPPTGRLAPSGYLIHVRPG